MAGIEKICEVCGDYPSGKSMYDIKANSIQVCPEHYPLFKNQPYILHVWIEAIYEQLKKKDWYTPSFERKGKPAKMARYYGYTLTVAGVPGKVDGEYLNWSYDMRAVKRKLRKILGVRGKKLKIKWISKETADMND